MNGVLKKQKHIAIFSILILCYLFFTTYFLINTSSIRYGHLLTIGQSTTEQLSMLIQIIGDTWNNFNIEDLA